MLPCSVASWIGYRPIIILHFESFLTFPFAYLSCAHWYVKFRFPCLTYTLHHSLRCISFPSVAEIEVKKYFYNIIVQYSIKRALKQLFGNVLRSIGYLFPEQIADEVLRLNSKTHKIHKVCKIRHSFWY